MRIEEKKFSKYINTKQVKFYDTKSYAYKMSLPYTIFYYIDQIIEQNKLIILSQQIYFH